jgi:hypothetical protein
MSTDLGRLRGWINRTRAGVVGLVAVTALAASQAASAAPMDITPAQKPV